MTDFPTPFFDEKNTTPNARLPQCIFLVGMPGAGKTSVGKKLAERLGWTFLDLDEAIEKAENSTVSEIFGQNGEAHFRAAERRALQKTFETRQIIVATGGGTPCFFDNILEMSRHGAIVFLTVGSTTLAERLWPEKSKRPMLEKLEKADFEAFLNQKLAERLPFYEKSDFKINATEAAEIVAEAIFEAIFG